MKILLITVICCSLIVSAQTQGRKDGPISMMESLNLVKIRNRNTNTTNTTTPGEPSTNTTTPSNSSNKIKHFPLATNSTTPIPAPTPVPPTLTQREIRVLDLSKANFYKIEPETQVYKYYNSSTGFYEAKLVYNHSNVQDPFPQGTYFMIDDTLVVINLEYNAFTQNGGYEINYNSTQSQQTKESVHIPHISVEYNKGAATTNEKYLKKITVNGSSEVFGMHNEISQTANRNNNSFSIFEEPLIFTEQDENKQVNVNAHGVHKKDGEKAVVNGTSSQSGSNFDMVIIDEGLLNVEVQNDNNNYNGQSTINNYNSDGDYVDTTSQSFTDDYKYDNKNLTLFDGKFSYDEAQKNINRGKQVNDNKTGFQETVFTRDISLLEFTHRYIEKYNDTYFEKQDNSGIVGNQTTIQDTYHNNSFGDFSMSHNDYNKVITTQDAYNVSVLGNNTITDVIDVHGFIRTKYNETYTNDQLNELDPSDSTYSNTTNSGSYMTFPNTKVGRLINIRRKQKSRQDKKSK